MCRICARNGVSRDGGRIGLCWQHAKRRCDVCGGASAGERTCTTCLHRVDVARWKARSNPLYFEEGAEHELQAMRVERLLQGKFHFHAAVETLFRGLLLVVEAVHGRPPRRVDDDHGPKEFRQAA